MKKYILTFIIIIVLIFTVSACGNSGKISDRKFTRILEDYEVFFEEEFVEEFGKDHCGAKIVINDDGTPVMLASGKDENTGEVYTRLYSHDGKNVVQLKKFGENIVPVIYSDGIVAVYDYSKEEVHGDVYLLGKDLEKIGDIDFERREIEIDYNNKEYILKAPVDGEEYAEFVDFIYDILYGNKVKPDKLAYRCNIFKSVTFFKSVPLAYFEDQGMFETRDFEDQIEELKDTGSMTQEEFLIWDYNFSEESDVDEHSTLLTYAFAQRDINLLNQVEEIHWSDYEEDFQKEILYIMLQNRMTEWMDESEAIKDISSFKVEEVVEQYTENLILNYGGKEPEFYIEEPDDGGSEIIYWEESDHDEAQYNSLIRSNFVKKAREEVPELPEGEIDKEWLDSYFVLIDQLSEKAEKWEEEFLQGDYVYLEAYIKLIEDEYYYDGAPYALYYDFCYVGEDNHLCMLLTTEYDYGAYTTLCVYDGTGGFTYYDLDGYRQWCAWVDEIKGWYTCGSNGASSGGETLVTVKEGKVYCLFNGAYDYFTPEGKFEIALEPKEYVNGYPVFERKSVSSEEYNKLSIELFGVPISSLAEKVTNNGRDYYETKRYSTIEEAYRNIETY